MRTSTGHRRPISTLLDLFRGRRRRPERKSPLARSRPRLEALEERLAPALTILAQNITLDETPGRVRSLQCARNAEFCLAA